MASKRMFAKNIIETDEFMDMPMATKALYFLLGMEADDEGFVSPARVMRIYGGEPDDLKILIGKGFIIKFESGVIVITDWHENNYLNHNRMKETKYQAEKALLSLSSNKYQLLNKSLTLVKPVEYRLDKISIIPKGIRAKALPREDINILLDKLKNLLGVLDGSKLEQRRTAKNFLDSKTPEILKCAGNANPNKEQIINATLRIFQLATQDNFHRKNVHSMKYIYNKAASIVQSQKNSKPSVGVIS